VRWRLGGGGEEEEEEDGIASRHLASSDQGWTGLDWGLAAAAHEPHEGLSLVDDRQADRQADPRKKQKRKRQRLCLGFSDSLAGSDLPLSSDLDCGLPLLGLQIVGRAQPTPQESIQVSALAS
jgi:hypothetical protein